MILDLLRGRDTPQARKFLSDDANALLENKLFQGAFAAVAAHLENVALGCEPDNKDKAQRVIISKQLLTAIRREIERVVEDGEMAEIEMAEIEDKKKRLRFVR